MAEQILFNFAERLVWKLGSYVFQQVKLAWGVKKELEKLEETMTTLKNLLLDAEERQEKSLTVREWLQRVKYALYEADDLVDEFATETLRKLLVEAQGSRRRKARDFFSCSNPIAYRYGIGSRVKDVRLKLDQILKDKTFELVVKVMETKPEPKGREETFSFVSSSEVIGRESDRDRLMEMIMSCNEEESHIIIPMVGLGGLGKTKLAQLVYNDSRIKSQFDKSIWVSVSDDFDVEKIITKMLQALNVSDCDNLALEALQSRLRKELSGKSYFLVLDDVWNEDRVEWTKLRGLLMGIDGRSVMLVTTRSEMVSSIMGTVPPYNLEGLSDEDCLSVFLKWAFNKGDERKHPNLVRVGREIVKKCHGFPLAAQTLGGLLYMKSDIREWLAVRDSELWAVAQKENGIMPILKLSYDQMPSYLKQCFAYCSLFQKDKMIDKWMLIFLWMAQGYIWPSNNQDEELEDIGERRINELVKRSFLEEKSRGPNRESYTMHDLVHDLAQYVAGSECLKVTATTRTVPERLMHVSFNLSRQDQPGPLFKREKLRTFVAYNDKLFTEGHHALDQAVISNFKYLRVLKLKGNIIEVPKSIGDLKHLRSLLLDTFSGMTLPASIGKLLNLQHLHLRIRWFPEVSMFELPEAVGDLVNLRYLSLYSTFLVRLPTKIAGWISLQRLRISMALQLRLLSEEMQFLHCLRYLEIRGCPLLTSLPPGMQGLTALEELYISTCQDLDLLDDDLQGLTSLRKLTLYDLPRLVSLPHGLKDSACTLLQLRIVLCSDLVTLSDSLEYLTSLQKLEIYNCPNLLSLPEGVECLTELCSLTISDCRTLSARCISGSGEDWSKIEHIPEIVTDYETIRTIFMNL